MIDGSSPLARGTPQSRENSFCITRLIPARAGNTPWRGRSANIRAAHPRSRGEHIPTHFLPTPFLGSSPLARGTPLRVKPISPTRRLIPARAGNTGTFWRYYPSYTAHPRSRGEHLRTVVSPGISSGSSPLARGTPADARWWCHGTRLIPARAGNTPSLVCCLGFPPAHPRSRGEHSFFLTFIV